MVRPLVCEPPPVLPPVVTAVVRTLSPLIAPTRLQSLQLAAAQRCGGVHLAFENVVQNDNVAAALRTAECAGIHHVHLIRGPQALASKRGGSLKRVDNALSKDAERWLQLHYHHDTTAFIQAMRDAGHTLLGADVVTLPPKILTALYKHPLTDKGLDAFISDWKGTGQSIL